MIIRIVKMTFHSERVEDFLNNFHRNKKSIRNFEGCTHLELLQEKNKDNVFFTYSYWEEEENLENYRHSALFKEVWAYTKTLFSEKPQAWSVERKVEL